MEIQLLHFMLIFSLSVMSMAASLNRQSFPDDFLFGASTSAYQLFHFVVPQRCLSNLAGFYLGPLCTKSIYKCDTTLLCLRSRFRFHLFSIFISNFAIQVTILISSSREIDLILGFVFRRFKLCHTRLKIEGASKVDGKGPNMWDIFTHKYPEKIADLSNGDIADDFYHRFKGDVKIVKEIGLDALRFSISWSRILPRGKLSGGVNQVGIQFYNALINELLANGIKPFVTLFHWDVPQGLEDDYGGFLSYNIVDDFRDYVDLCFREFGDRVKYWTTMNEPNTFSINGYAEGVYAPGHCSMYIGKCTTGNSATEPYQVMHNLLLAHASAVKLYKQRYQESQKGVIGLIISCEWFTPFSNSTEDLDAAVRAWDFKNGWVLEPITFGRYPQIMRSIVGSRLPHFTIEQSKMLKHAYDFLGLNYYTTNYAANDNSSTSITELSYTTDSHVVVTFEKDGVPIGEPTAINWLYIYPEGIRYMTNYVKDVYDDPPIIITENGVAQENNLTLPFKEALQDYQRIRYHTLHLTALLDAIRDGVHVQGYFLWSILDDFEWNYGYTVRFGVNYIDYRNDLKRYPKYSALWFKTFLRKESVSDGLGYSPV